MMFRRNAALLPLLVFLCMLALATAAPSGATPPGMKGPPSHDVTGCVRGADLIMAEPQPGSGMISIAQFRIVPCVDAPFDFHQYNGKLIRARGQMDSRGKSFICPREVVILGDCPQGFAAPPPSSDSTRCGTIDPKKVKTPEDFEISYVSGPAHADWGGRKALAVTAKGEVTEKEGKPGRPAPGEAPMERVTTYRISTNRVKQIYGQVLACNFFELNTRYAARGIMDGSTESLRVRADGREHSVSVSNTHVERFNRIVDVLHEAGKPEAGTSKKIRELRQWPVTAREAEQIVWGLPEVRARAAAIQNAAAKPAVRAVQKTTVKAGEDTSESAWLVVYSEDRTTRTESLMTFLIGEQTGKIFVRAIDDASDVPLEEYRRKQADVR